MKLTDSYSYEDQEGIHTLTVKEIFDTFQEDWLYKMRRAGKWEDISVENCVNDFIAINYAWKQEK